MNTQFYRVWKCNLVMHIFYPNPFGVGGHFGQMFTKRQTFIQTMLYTICNHSIVVIMGYDLIRQPAKYIFPCPFGIHEIFYIHTCGITAYSQDDYETLLDKHYQTDVFILFPSGNEKMCQLLTNLESHKTGTLR